ncbi:hypothetical protein N0V93_004243 [Gnomoniopsis smithogilvyi]|uniref:RTA1-like protein n=1 Tax=Gnomoniopsis smithogilvyi TaxID=1191159 RepID=A0A9W8YS99_9PEZI|nr:hypothetical protein N0V93_004243 [Gnomoniopsis smithogilvyi]
MSGDCTSVTPECPVEATTLGYYPNKPLNIVIAVLFGIAAVIALVLGIRKRSWSYMSFLVVGCILEMAGYIGRVLMSNNPWDSGAFQLQIVTIILAPTVVCISLYLTLKRLTSNINPELSRIRPRLYPLIFCPSDVACLVVQAIGGGLAASGETNLKLLNDGNHMIIAGVALQVVVLLAFGGLCADYMFRARRWVRSSEATDEARTLWADRRFRIFRFTTMVAYAAVQIRCIYRIVEFAGGWGNHIMQDQASFVVLDSFLMLICVFLLACFPPDIFVRVRSSTAGGDSSAEETKASSPVP